MARLPTPAALGPAQTPYSQRAIVRVRAPGELERAQQGAALQTAQAASEIGRFATDRLDRMDRLDYATAKSSFLQAKAQADMEFERDPDYATAAGRYQERLDDVRQKTLGGIRNNQVRATFDESIKADIAQGRTRISSLAFGRERDAGRAHINDLISKNRQSALNTSDPYTSNSILQATRDAVDGAVAKGYLTEQEAGIKNRAFAESYAEGRIGLMPIDQQVDALRSGMLLTEQGMAFEKTGTFADFLPADRRMAMLEGAERSQTQAYERANKEATKQAKLLSDNLSKEGATLLSEGKLTAEWVKEREDSLNAKTYASLLKAATGDEAIADDRPLVADLYKAISDGIDITDRTIDAYAAKNLKRATMNTILSRNDTMQGKGAPGTAYQRSSEFLKSALRPSDMVANPDASAAYANAEVERQQYFDENPQATVTEGLDFTKSLATAYRITPHTAFSLPYSTWMVGDRNARKPDLDATEAQIARDLDSGAIGRDEARRRALDVRSWRDFEAAGAQ